MFFKKLPPALKITIGYFLVIIIGFLLLLLPFSSKSGVSIKAIDAFFTSASAVCVTGLTVIPNINETLSIFGKIILVILIQVGGLGFVTIAVFVLMSIGIKIGATDRYFIKEALNQNSTRGIIKLIKTIIFTTLVIEGVGAIGYFIVFIQDYDFFKAVGKSLFHAVSAFNNCGFDILGSTSLIDYKDNILLNSVTSMLIILGGIGFIVIEDVRTTRNFKKLAIHSKIVLIMTLILLVSGTVFLKFSEGITNNEFTWLQAFFQSVSARTAGFATVDFCNLNSLTNLIMIVYMFIGASPCSTGGGIKTTTLFTMAKSVSGYSTGKKTIVYGRWISDDTKLRAFALTSLSICSVILATILLLAFEKNNGLSNITFEKAMFEATSAFGTVGLSMGLTPNLYPISKLLICLIMFLGRVGPLTIFSLFNRNWNKIDSSSIKYVEEKIIIG